MAQLFHEVNKIELGQLLEGLKHRDHVTLKYIYKNHFPMVLGYILRHGGNEEDAKDIFQETIIVLYKMLQGDKLCIEEDFGSYLVGVSKRLWLKQIRSNNIHQRFVDQLDQEVVENHPSDQEIENEYELGIIRKYVLKLGDDCQKVLMWGAEGFSSQEIADKLSYKSEKTVRMKKYRCKEYLIRLIKGDPHFKGVLEVHD